MPFVSLLSRTGVNSHAFTFSLFFFFFNSLLWKKFYISFWFLKKNLDIMNFFFSDLVQNMKVGVLRLCPCVRKLKRRNRSGSELWKELYMRIKEEVIIGDVKCAFFFCYFNILSCFFFFYLHLSSLSQYCALFDFVFHFFSWFFFLAEVEKKKKPHYFLNFFLSECSVQLFWAHSWTGSCLYSMPIILGFFKTVLKWKVIL